MVKFLLNFFCVFLMLSTFALAKNKIDEAYLKAQYGPKLDKAPYFLRLGFQSHYNKPWADSYYTERKVYLTRYEQGQADDDERARQEARAEAQRAREDALAQREKDRANREKLRAEREQERAEQKEYDDRQKAMYDAERQQRQELRDMQHQFSQGN